MAGVHIYSWKGFGTGLGETTASFHSNYGVWSEFIGIGPDKVKNSQGREIALSTRHNLFLVSRHLPLLSFNGEISLLGLEASHETIRNVSRRRSNRRRSRDSCPSASKRTKSAQTGRKSRLFATRLLRSEPKIVALQHPRERAGAVDARRQQVDVSHRCIRVGKRRGRRARLRDGDGGSVGAETRGEMSRNI